MAKKKNKAEKKEKDIKAFVKDKAFGMKNKKNSKKVEKMVKGIASQEKGGYEKIKYEKFIERKKQKQEEEEKAFLAQVFGGAVAPKFNAQANDPNAKPICQFFKANLCSKGKKCKFSHDLNQGGGSTNQNSQKINIFKDTRDDDNVEKMEDWGAKELDEAVNFNQKKYNGSKTKIVCKFFLTALEKMTYGWFWKCPNGYSCKFNHCLPPGFKFKSKKKEEDNEEQKEDIELRLIKEIDAERELLDTKKSTPVTKELFFKWVAIRRRKKQKERDARIQKFMTDRGIKRKKKVTGKQLFEKNKSVFTDAEGATGKLDREEPVDNEPIKNHGDVKLAIDEDVFDDEDLPDL